MILYFSGTGNSAYVARQLGELLQEETIDVFARIRDKDTTALQAGRPWIVVCPTYAWRIPRILDVYKRQEMRWAMMILVVPGIFSAKAFRILASVAVSTALVESSKINTFGFFNRARAMQSRCFWPPDTFCLLYTSFQYSQLLQYR